MRLSFSSSVAVSCALASCAIAAPVITPLTQFGGVTFSEGLAISADGTAVAGNFELGGRFGFRWTAATGMVPIDAISPLGIGSATEGMSGDGNVVVGTSRVNARVKPFRWTAAGGTVALPDVTEESAAVATSFDGSVTVGFSLFPQAAVRWTAAGGQSLGYLPGGNISFASDVSDDGSVVVGRANVNSSFRAFRWTEAGGMQSLGGLPGFEASSATAVSGNGLVIAGASSQGGLTRAVRWVGSTITDLGLLPGTISADVIAISGDGNTIIGSLADGSPNGRFFYWNTADGMVDLSQLLIQQGTDLTGWTDFLRPSALSHDGRTMSGTGIYNGQFRAFVISNIPGPGAASCVVAGGLCVLRRRRRA